EILEGAKTYSSATEAVRQHELDRPPEPAFPEVQGSVTPAELRMLALRLREPGGVFSNVDEKLRQRSSVRKELEQLAKSRSLSIGVIGAMSLLAVLPLVFFEGQAKLLGAGGVFLAVVIAGLVIWQRKSTPIVAKRQALQTLEEELDASSRGLSESGRRQKE